MYRDKVEAARDELKRRLTRHAMDAEVMAKDRVPEKENTHPSYHVTLDFYRVWASGLHHILCNYLLVEVWLDNGCSCSACHNAPGGGERFCERCEEIYRVLDDLDDPGEDCPFDRDRQHDDL